MTFYEWFTAQCVTHNTTPSAVAVAVGVSPAAANGWKGGSMPKSVTLMRIENYFGEKYSAPTTDDTLQTLKDEEKALLHSYRTMTEEQKRMMSVFIKGLKNDS
jgi:hypothetical protein